MAAVTVATNRIHDDNRIGGRTVIMIIVIIIIHIDQ